MHKLKSTLADLQHHGNSTYLWGLDSNIYYEWPALDVRWVLQCLPKSVGWLYLGYTLKLQLC